MQHLFLMNDRRKYHSSVRLDRPLLLIMAYCMLVCFQDAGTTMQLPFFNGSIRLPEHYLERSAAEVKAHLLQTGQDTLPIYSAEVMVQNMGPHLQLKICIDPDRTNNYLLFQEIPYVPFDKEFREHYFETVQPIAERVFDHNGIRFTLLEKSFRQEKHFAYFKMKYRLEAKGIIFYNTSYFISSKDRTMAVSVRASTPFDLEQEIKAIRTP